ncbi:hypothetical protein PENTCL1PPCAC_21563, partial [Pristionchus entomophagus]
PVSLEMLRLLRLLLFFTILHCAFCECPYQLALYRDGQCRGYYSDWGMYRNDAVNGAIDYCQQIQAYPVSIHNDEQLLYWSAQKRDYLFVLGLTCNTNSKQWEWTDGTTFDFKPDSLNYDTELVQDCKTSCSWFLDSDGSWHIDCSDEYEAVDVFCALQLTQPIPSTDCGNFIDDSDDGICYEIAVGGENWKDAQSICRSFGGQVSSVHNQQENSYIRRLAVSRGATNGVLLGAVMSGKGDDFGWIDGTEWDYENFHPGFPLDGFGQCLTMDTITTAGQWMNTDCDAKMPVVCARPLHDTPETSGCTAGPWKEGQIIYSPGFPNDASVPCEFFLSVAVGSQVKLDLLLLEANSCCDYLEITDGYVGGTIIANLTGDANSGKTYYTSTSNIMRVIWQPNGGVNVRGLVMTFSTW